MKFRVGVDVGGTFTDLALLSAEGRLYVFKVPTRPADIATCCLDGLETLLREADVNPSDVDYWSHGTTVATNAVVERKGAKTALLTTEGFRDILEIRRQVKPDTYNLHRLKPKALVPRDRRLEVKERILWDGSVYLPLDEKHLEARLHELEVLGIESVAICFLHAYVNPAHEEVVQERLRKRLPNVYVSASHEVLSEFREYPRCSTTVMNAYVGPVMEQYLERFEQGGRKLGIRPPLTIFQSNGGIISASGATRLPIKVLHSGPAAGVQGAVQIAQEAGYTDLITFDMGGTSCDVCLIRDGIPLLETERELSGFPVRTSMIDVHSIGAGGGSIAWIDSGGLLQVGAQSAGAYPGPACYGQGGLEATVTDANVVLGRLNPEYLLGGRLKIHEKLARSAIARLAQRLNLSLEQAALGILDVVNSNMMGAIRVVSVERGFDFRDYVLVAFGGAGPLHGAEVAREMGIRTVLAPRAPGILCALGLLLADYRSDLTHTRILPVQHDAWRDIRDVFAALEERAWKWARQYEIPVAEAKLSKSVHMRYIGQSHELAVPATSVKGPSDVDLLLENFHHVHKTAYGYAQLDAAAETVDFHVTLIAPVARPEIKTSREDQRSRVPSRSQCSERPVWFNAKTGPVTTPIYNRYQLPALSKLSGPAILEQLDSTIVVPPGMMAVTDESGNIHITVSN